MNPTTKFITLTTHPQVSDRKMTVFSMLMKLIIKFYLVSPLIQQVLKIVTNASDSAQSTKCVKTNPTWVEPWTHAHKRQ